MKHKIYKKSLAMLLVSVGVLSNSGAIHANENSNLNISKLDKSVINERVSSPSGSSSATVYGTLYKWKTVIDVTSSVAKGYTQVDASKTVPAGYMGAHANLYDKASGKVVATSEWGTNPVAAIGYANTTYTTSKVGTYFVRGTVKLYTGNGYEVLGAKQSPELSIRSLNIKISDEELKERQQLYDTKNMIAAIGVNDVEGYVSLDDLYNTKNQPETPEEFIEMQRNYKEFRMVPLYSTDGETIIGEYRIDA